jgi:hypothetical protein
MRPRIVPQTISLPLASVATATASSLPVEPKVTAFGVSAGMVVAVVVVLVVVVVFVVDVVLVVVVFVVDVVEVVVVVFVVDVVAVVVVVLVVDVVLVVVVFVVDVVEVVVVVLVVDVVAVVVVVLVVDVVVAVVVVRVVDVVLTVVVARVVDVVATVVVVRVVDVVPTVVVVRVVEVVATVVVVLVVDVVATVVVVLVVDVVVVVDAVLVASAEHIPSVSGFEILNSWAPTLSKAPSAKFTLYASPPWIVSRKQPDDPGSGGARGIGPPRPSSNSLIWNALPAFTRSDLTGPISPTGSVYRKPCVASPVQNARPVRMLLPGMSGNVALLAVPPSTAIMSSAPSTVGSPTIVFALGRSFAFATSLRRVPSVGLALFSTNILPRTIRSAAWLAVANASRPASSHRVATSRRSPNPM